MSVCTAVKCETLTDPDNGGVMFTTTTYLSIANYTCDTGYNLVGVDQRTCTAAGIWGDGEPTCQSETGYRMLLCIYLHYSVICGMLRGRLQRKSSAHIRDVCTLP